MKQLEVNTLKNITVPMKWFSPMYKDTDDEVSVTEWPNGEGWDISFNDKHFSLSIDELDAINYITKTLDFNHYGCHNDGDNN